MNRRIYADHAATTHGIVDVRQLRAAFERHERNSDSSDASLTFGTDQKWRSVSVASEKSEFETPHIGLVSVMTANNEIGTINPIHLLSEFAHKRGALFHTDAVQAVGHIPIDVCEMGIDFLSASAHKFNAPKGIGFLYIRKGQKLRSLDGGQQENGSRAGTENVAAIVGMAIALKNNCARMDEISAHLEELTLHLRMGIERFYDNPVFLGSGIGSQLPGFTSVSFPGHPAEGRMHMLDLKGIAASTGAACDSRNTRVSHVLNAINAPNDIAHSTIRITFGSENTPADVDAILSALKQILQLGGSQMGTGR